MNSADEIPEWERDIRAVFSYSVPSNTGLFKDANNWCNENFGPDADLRAGEIGFRPTGRWTWFYDPQGRRIFYFKDAIIAVEFKLRFG